MHFAICLAFEENVQVRDDMLAPVVMGGDGVEPRRGVSGGILNHWPSHWLLARSNGNRIVSSASESSATVTPVIASEIEHRTFDYGLPF